MPLCAREPCYLQNTVGPLDLSGTIAVFLICSLFLARFLLRRSTYDTILHRLLLVEADR